MKVLFLTRYPEDGASSRYRVYQYIPYLKRHNVTCDIMPFMSPTMYRYLYKRGKYPAKIALFVIAVLKRLLVLFQARKYDLIFMQREILPFGPPVMERIFRYLKLPMIFDYDDALFLFKSSMFNRISNVLKNPDKIFEIFSIVNCVLAGNKYLAERAQPFCDDVRTFHVAEDLNRYTRRQQNKSSEVFTIGWLGSPSTEKYLDIIIPALQIVCRRYQHVQVKVIGGGRFAPDGVSVLHVPWAMDTEINELHTFDVGIMPLPQEEWSLGKSGGKARTYMAVGVPAVCTAIGFNRELITHGTTGFLVKTQDEWVTAITQLIESPELRQGIGDKARRAVEEKYSLEVLAPELYTLLKEVSGV